jgi:hypothetical protein
LWTLTFAHPWSASGNDDGDQHAQSPQDVVSFTGVVMMKIHAGKTGAACALSIAAEYIFLSILFVLWPSAGAAFHQAITADAVLDPGNGEVAWSLIAFVFALAIVLVWAFATGALFASIYNALHRAGRGTFGSANPR